VSLWQPRLQIGARLVNDIGAWCWNELVTTDVERGKAFFGELLGWTYETDDSGYTSIKNAGHLNGGMRRQSEEVGDVEPYWLPYFTVEGSDEAARPSPLPAPGGPSPDLVVTKRADRLRATRGEIVTYRLRVTNNGEATAEEIIAGDLPGAGARVVSTSARGRRCHAGRILYCRIKALRPGQSVTAKLRLRLLETGRFTNAAAAISSTPEPTYRNNRAAARVRVRRVPPFCLSVAALSFRAQARAAC
jgi:uncharacterized repeat protein (TIGR01451 family)